MPHVNINGILDDEVTRLNALLNATPAPSPFTVAVVNKTIQRIATMRKRAVETEDDYSLRINLMAQDAPQGEWSNSFWSQLDAAVAADTSVYAKGGLGRGA